MSDVNSFEMELDRTEARSWLHNASTELTGVLADWKNKKRFVRFNFDKVSLYLRLTNSDGKSKDLHLYPGQLRYIDASDAVVTLFCQNLKGVSVFNLSLEVFSPDELRKSLNYPKPKYSVTANDWMVIADDFTLDRLAKVQSLKLPLPCDVDEVSFDDIELLFIESSWEGNRGAWTRLIANNPSLEVKRLIQRARDKNKPIVFWNKEDPFHFNHFVEIAKDVDFIFTTDQDLVPLYQETCSPKLASLAPFPVDLSEFLPPKHVEKKTAFLPVPFWEQIR